jgi:hypothetical protein
MVSILAWSAVDHGFEPLLGQTKDYYKIGICCFSIRPTKKKCVFPIAWSSKLGSVGRDFFFFFFFETYKYMYAPSSKITQTCLFISYYSLLIIWHAVQCFCYHLCVFSILYFYCWSWKQTRKRRWISRFCRSIIFLA